jgi:hypothetical protein
MLCLIAETKNTMRLMSVRYNKKEKRKELKIFAINKL